MMCAKRSALFILLGMPAVIAGMLLAIAFYPIPFSWTSYQLSVLGMTELKDGTSNYLSSVLFGGALSVGGVLGFAYFRSRAACSRNQVIARFLLAFGAVGGVGLIGIGLTPYNLVPQLHNGFTWIASIGLGGGVLFSLGAIRDSGTNVAENILWLLFGLFVLAVWASLEWMRGNGMLPQSPTEQIQQKVVVGYAWLYAFWNCLRLYWYSRGQTAHA